MLSDTRPGMKTVASPNEQPAEGVTSDVYSDEQWSTGTRPVPSELPLTIYVNGQELVTILCTPSRLNCLVLGFLYSEGIVNGMQDILNMRVCEDDSLADVKLKVSYTPPTRRMLTSGCGGGTSFKLTERPVQSKLTVSPERLLELMKQMLQHQELFRESGGIHCSALAVDGQGLIIAEDIGRHNTLDKIAGECLLRRIPMRDGILLTTGRISSEMLLKAAHMETPVVVSRSSVTNRAVGIGRELGITVVAYARATRLSVYSGRERVARKDKV